MRQEIGKQANELEETLRQAHKVDEGFYRELLTDYIVGIWALKSIGDLYPLDRAIDLEEQRSNIEARLSNVTEEEFEDYVVLWDLLGILYEEVT